MDNFQNTFNSPNITACATIQTLLNGQRKHDPRMACAVNGVWDYNTINSLNIMVKALFDVTIDITPIFGDAAGNYMRWYDKLQGTVRGIDCLSLYDSAEYRCWNNGMVRCFEQIVLLWRNRIIGLPEEYFESEESKPTTVEEPRGNVIKLQPRKI